MRLIDADALMNQWCDEMCKPKPNCEEDCAVYDYVRLAPTIEPKAKVIAQVTFDEEKMREIVKEAVERFKEEYEIEPKRGEWINMGDFEQCSACKGTHLKEFQTYYGKATWIKTDFCPNCGARMKGADDD